MAYYWQYLGTVHIKSRLIFLCKKFKNKSYLKNAKSAQIYFTKTTL